MPDFCDDVAGSASSSSSSSSVSSMSITSSSLIGHAGFLDDLRLAGSLVFFSFSFLLLSSSVSGAVSSALAEVVLSFLAFLCGMSGDVDTGVSLFFGTDGSLGGSLFSSLQGSTGSSRGLYWLFFLVFTISMFLPVFLRALVAMAPSGHPRPILLF